MIERWVTRTRRKLFLIASLGTMALLVACSNSSSSSGTLSTIKVGLIEPLSGFSAEFGGQAVDGATLALKQHSYTVNGHPVQLIQADDACTPDTGINAANRLIGDGVVAVIGPECTAVTAAIGPILKKAQIPYLVGAQLAQLSQQGDPYFFRAKASDQFVFKALVDQMSAQGLTTRIGLARDTGSYGNSSGETFINALHAAGFASPVVDVSYDDTATDFTGQIQAVRKANPTVLVVISFEDSAGLFIKQSRQLGFNVPAFTQVGGAQTFADAAGSAVEGVSYVARFSFDDPATKSFTDAFNAEYSKNPEEPGAGNYFAMSALLDALSRGPDATGSQLRDLLRAASLQTTVWHAGWNSTGELTQQIVLVGHYQNQKRVILKRVTGTL